MSVSQNQILTVAGRPFREDLSIAVLVLSVFATFQAATGWAIHNPSPLGWAMGLLRLQRFSGWVLRDASLRQALGNACLFRLPSDSRWLCDALLRQTLKPVIPASPTFQHAACTGCD